VLAVRSRSALPLANQNRGRTPMDDAKLERSAMRRIGWRLVPFLILAYFVSFLDRVNVGFAAIQMNKDLGFTATVRGGPRISDR
jgi:hypothetical protein